MENKLSIKTDVQGAVAIQQVLQWVAENVNFNVQQVVEEAKKHGNLDQKAVTAINMTLTFLEQSIQNVIDTIVANSDGCLIKESEEGE